MIPAASSGVKTRSNGTTSGGLSNSENATLVGVRASGSAAVSLCNPDNADKLSKSMPSASSKTLAGSATAAEVSEAAGNSAAKNKSKSITLWAAAAESAAAVGSSWLGSTVSGSLAISTSSPTSTICPGSVMALAALTGISIAARSSANARAGGASGAAGICNGTKRPSIPMASALMRNGVALQPASRLAAMSSIQPEKPVMALAAKVLNPSVAGFCSASRLLTICSMHQAASPNSLRPTIRELPFNV